MLSYLNLNLLMIKKHKKRVSWMINKNNKNKEVML